MTDVAATSEPGQGSVRARSLKRSFATPGAVSLRVENYSGKVEIDTHDIATTEIVLVAMSPAAGEVVEHTRINEKATALGHEVIVEVPQSRGKARLWLGNGAAVSVSVKLPRDAQLDISTASAWVNASGRYRAATIRTTSGAIAVGEVAGEARVRTMSGDVALEAVDGVVDVQSASGDVKIGVAASGGKISTVSGDIDLGRSGEPTRIHTASGEVRISEALRGIDVESVSGDQRIERATAGECLMRAVSGDILVAVVPGSLVCLDAGSLSGRVSSDIEVEPSRPPVRQGEPDGPELLIQAKTVSGAIAVVRARAESTARQ